MPLVIKPPPQQRPSPGSALPRLCSSALNRISDLAWEARLGVHTTGGAPSPHPDAHHYGYLAYHTYFSILDRLAMQPGDVIADLGAGKGRVVCAAATYPIRKVIGIELDQPLCAQGAANVARMRARRAPVEFVCQSAADFNYDEVTIAVMFHPFGADTLNRVLERIEESLARRPRRVRIAYGNPILGALLTARPWLRCYECWTPRAWSRIKFPVHFYAAA